ncbi:glycosyltransferase family 61 protein [archaeon]|nr:MAG: glycosyltransferase family 61 protein [archaeon]
MDVADVMYMYVTLPRPHLSVIALPLLYVYAYLQMENVMMDFSKMNEGGSSRSFQAGFLTIFGAIDHKERAYLPIYPGLHTQFGHPSQCTTYANDTVYMLSNDDIFNLGHYMNDVMNVWMQIVMTEQVGTSSSASSTSPSATAKVLLNIDGLRAGGPAGGHPHRLMVPSAPDSHGPYAPAYYQSWFRGKVTKAVDYKPNKVCFRKLVTLPTPGVPWFWNDWGRINDCAVSAPSPLYQSFSYFLRKQAQQGLGIVLSLPPADKIHIVIEVREINKSKGNNHSSGRYIKNRQALIEELRKIPGVVVTAQNFAALSFTEQIQLAHTASILISMHGAGTTHIFHMAVGSKNCCGLLELFPDPSIEFHTAHGYENLAKMLGFHHRRFVSKAGSTVADGTTLDVQAVGRLARDLVNEVKKKPTCMHDAKDY